MITAFGGLVRWAMDIIGGHYSLVKERKKKKTISPAVKKTKKLLYKISIFFSIVYGF